ncbi:MAG: DMT family transporter [Desulfobacterales bacterium]|nr:DMT family transporter [Desulfobacterales bacterium]
MNHLFGIGLIIISAVSFGAMAIFAHFVYGAGISTHSLLFFRFFFAALPMVPIALIQKRKFPRGKDLGILIAMGAVGYAGQAWTYFTALTLIPASLVAILLYLYPVFVAVLSVFFLDEVLTKKKVLALVLAIGGAVLVIGLDIGGNLTGILYGIGAALIYSVYNIVGARVMKRNDTFTASLVIILSAAGFYFILNMTSGMVIPREGIYWVYMAAIGFLCTFVAIYTYFLGMKLIGAVNASMLSTFEPVTTVVLASLFLGQGIGRIQMAGAGLILVAALIIAAHPKKEKAEADRTFQRQA